MGLTNWTVLKEYIICAKKNRIVYPRQYAIDQHLGYYKALVDLAKTKTDFSDVISQI